MEFVATLDSRAPTYRRANRSVVQRFLVVVTEKDSEPARVVIDEARLLQWMLTTLRGHSVEWTRKQLGIVNQYLQVLVQAEVIPANPMHAYRQRRNNPAWGTMVQALQSADPETALADLRNHREPTGPLDTAIRDYLELQRSLGKAYRPQQYLLSSLNQFLLAQAVASAQSITSNHIEQWISTMKGCQRTRHEHTTQVQRFFEYLHQLKVVSHNPVVPVLFREVRPPRSSFCPFIFTKDQMKAILSKAGELTPNQRFPLRRSTCFTMLAMLYGLGLRHGEACRLQICDVDLSRQILFIRETKFHKSRFVPFGPRMAQRLKCHLDVRRTILPPLRNEDAFFVTFRRTPVSLNTLLSVFHQILIDLAIEGIPGQRPPRLHDLRHTFAVDRLLRWYEDGGDIQSRLPILSTFLGHVEPVATEKYLTVTADLLREASGRFCSHFGQHIEEEPLP